MSWNTIYICPSINNSISAAGVAAELQRNSNWAQFLSHLSWGMYLTLTFNPNFFNIVTQINIRMGPLRLTRWADPAHPDQTPVAGALRLVKCIVIALSYSQVRTFWSTCFFFNYQTTWTRNRPRNRWESGGRITIIKYIKEADELQVKHMDEVFEAFISARNVEPSDLGFDDDFISREEVVDQTLHSNWFLNACYPGWKVQG